MIRGIRRWERSGSLVIATTYFVSGSIDWVLFQGKGGISATFVVVVVVIGLDRYERDAECFEPGDQAVESCGVGEWSGHVRRLQGEVDGETGQLVEHLRGKATAHLNAICQRIHVATVSFITVGRFTLWCENPG